MEQFTLGRLIFALEGFAPDRIVSFAFGRFDVTSVASYRGYYGELALGWREPAYNHPSKTVGELVAHLKGALGAEFEGYKGGTYRMDARTPMWAAKWGDSSQAVIVGATADGLSSVMIETASAAKVGR